jgi:hypothetical protein
VIIISAAFGYSLVTRNRAVQTPSTLEDDHKEKTK